MSSTTFTLRSQFTQHERVLLLKLLNLFSKYSEVDWNCTDLAKRWDCSSRSVQRLFKKLKDLGWIQECRVRYREFTRKATEMFLSLKEKISQTVAIQSRSSRDGDSLKKTTQVNENQGNTMREKNHINNKHNHKKEDLSYKIKEGLPSLAEILVNHPMFEVKGTKESALAWYEAHPDETLKFLNDLTERYAAKQAAHLPRALYEILTETAPKLRSQFGRTADYFTAETPSGVLKTPSNGMEWQDWLLEALTAFKVADPVQIISSVAKRLSEIVE